MKLWPKNVYNHCLWAYFYNSLASYEGGALYNKSSGYMYPYGISMPARSKFCKTKSSALLVWP